MLQLPDGSLLVSDEHNGAIYRVSYSGQACRGQALIAMTRLRAMAAVAGLRACESPPLFAEPRCDAALAAETPQERLQLCGTCHGENGNSKMEKMPSLAGQPELFLTNQLILFRERLRKSEVMEPFVKGLTDDEISGAGGALRQADA